MWHEAFGGHVVNGKGHRHVDDFCTIGVRDTKY
jgi:hypothetical protein